MGLWRFRFGPREEGSFALLMLIGAEVQIWWHDANLASRYMLPPKAESTPAVLAGWATRIMWRFVVIWLP